MFYGQHGGRGCAVARRGAVGGECGGAEVREPSLCIAVFSCSLSSFCREEKMFLLLYIKMIFF